MTRFAQIPPGVRAVFFDAVGTVLHPHPPAAEVYHTIASQFGSKLDPLTIQTRFFAAFASQEAHDRVLGLRTDEEREFQRWRTIVAEVLSDVADLEGAFQALYEHFSRSTAWRVEADASRVIGELLQSGFRIGLASNFDHRLRSVVAGLPELTGMSPLLISSEVGWRKPARGFFQAVCASVSLSPAEVLLVGDDLENDFRGAKESGLHVLLLDPRDRFALPRAQRLGRLGELIG